MATFIFKQDDLRAYLEILWCAIVLLLYTIAHAQPNPPRPICRTPGGTEVVFFEPTRFIDGINDNLNILQEKYNYTIVQENFQAYAPNPGPHESVGIETFVNLCQNPGNMGILYIVAHGREGHWDNPGLLLEFYRTVSTRNQAYQLLLHQFAQSDLMMLTIGPYLEQLWYGIGLTPSGIRTHCAVPGELTQVLVFPDVCYSADYVRNWDALVAVGWDDRVTGWEGSQHFFQSMLGMRYREEDNANRTARNAAEIVSEKLSFPPTPDLKYYPIRGECVVLAPMVLRHSPAHLKYIGTSPVNGWIEFDCKMKQDGIPAEDVVMLTGTHVTLPGPPFTSVWWNQDVSHKIEFSFPDLEDYCWVDIIVDHAHALSAGNEIQLDGNTNPPANYFTGMASGSQGWTAYHLLGDSNAIAPNEDYYNWTARVYNNPLVGFEGFSLSPDNWPEDGELIEIREGMIFHNDDPDYWRYGETNETHNVYPFAFSSGTPVSWADGRYAARYGDWTEAFRQVEAVIEFVMPVESVYLGYKLQSAATFWMFYVGGGAGWEDRPSNINAPENPFPYNVLSHSLSPIWLSSEPLPTEPPIERIEIHGYNERILIDNVMLFNTGWDALGMMNANFEGKLFEHEDIIPGGDPLSYAIDVPDIADSLMIICNWDTIIGQPVTFGVRDPTDKLVYEKETDIPPIKPPIFDDPLAGTWKMDVLAGDTDGKKFDVATVAGVTYEPLVDCFIGEEDIWFSKESPKLGDVFHVLVTTHAGDQFGTGVKSVLVKCYLGDPEDGIQIGGWHWAMNIQPGSFDTTCYQFNSEICAEVSPCEITVVVDPRNELEEYDEDNNVASKVITFGE